MAITAMSIALLYSLFAAFSTAINIGFQMLSIWLYKGLYAVEVSILVGTAAGLPLRYLLEKRYIFAFKSNDIAHDGRLFILYTFMGVFTTAIFWGVEYAFHLIFGTDTMRYVGGMIGLAIGFYVKYQLDKIYVFVGDHKKATI
jgi:putative flippase GtrA